MDGSLELPEDRGVDARIAHLAAELVDCLSEGVQQPNLSLKQPVRRGALEARMCVIVVKAMASIARSLDWPRLCPCSKDVPGVNETRLTGLPSLDLAVG